MRVRVGLAAVLVIATVLAGAVPAPAAAADPAGSQDALAPQFDEVDADEVRMDVAVRENGDAEWTLEFWIRLDDEESEAAFESLRSDVENDSEGHVGEFAGRMEETVAAASEATGREMSADEFAVETERQSVPREYGVVRYTFVWRGFAAVEGDELRVGDAVEGIYLDDGTRLLIAWPEGYELDAVAPDPDDRRERAVIWRGGRTDFVAGEPRVVVSPAGPGLALVAAATLVGAVGVAAVYWYRTHERRAPLATRTDDDDRGDDRGGRAEPPAGEEPATDLLSNEEQVLRLVEERGGRMKQQEVVSELGWTDAKTSKVVTGLREAGKLESFRLGRENVLSLPDEDESDE
ncbi:DUF7345 domain-containing protein [Salinilacihabitans rarus]|uniref:DUF7345 domain-containing protein n=1 Tax=Salinilacihabitans rarus TaxID=2961596 RepID=UPI0020C83A18|nr:hypothetical protein [Salinilacihabitans rarus]